MAIDFPLPTIRLKRLRQNPILRELLSETSLSVRDFVLPLFIKEGENIRYPIASMPGHFQLSVDQLTEELAAIQTLGIKAVILFGIPQEKDAQGSQAWHENGITQKAIRFIKQQAPDLLVISDVCLCEYTDHGHCGILQSTNQIKIDNDATLSLLTKIAISHARAGADIVAPSSMTDGMVGAIRRGLDQAGFQELPILSYAVKYASSLYSPFREAAEGAPKNGNRSTYQMNSKNSKEALREAQLDITEGADILMVKPAQFYLDILAQMKQHFPYMPLCAYQVSGEFAMIKAAGEKGWLDATQTMLESLIAIKRAGADLIISYFAKEAAQYLT